MTTQEPTNEFKVIYSQNGDGSYYYSFVKDIPKKEEKPLFSVQFGVKVYQTLFKKYLSDAKYRNKLFSEAGDVDNMSLLKMNENLEFVLNKDLIQVILKKSSFYSEYLKLEDNILMLALEGALNELHEVIERGVDHFLVIEMAMFKLAKNRSITRKEVEMECKKVLAELLAQVE